MEEWAKFDQFLRSEFFEMLDVFMTRVLATIAPIGPFDFMIGQFACSMTSSWKKIDWKKIVKLLVFNH